MTSELNLTDKLTEAGFRYPLDLIQAFLGGSHQHGAKLSGKGDIDIYGVYIETPTKVLGVEHEDNFTSGTQDQYEKNRPGDEDYKVYTLKRWAGLACKGNPTILGFMFTPIGASYIDSVWNRYILPNRSLFQASSHAAAFLGYAKGQVARLDGTKGRGKHGQRPELEVKFGFDTKAAMHMMRMMYECEEYLNTGIITYPRPEKDILLDIRNGVWNWDKLFAEYYAMEKKIREAETNSLLPKHVDREQVSQLITMCYLEHWNKRNQITAHLDKLVLWTG